MFDEALGHDRRHHLASVVRPLLETIERLLIPGSSKECCRPIAIASTPT
jgi:hypothetical protein